MKNNHRFPVLAGVSSMLAVAIFMFVGLAFAQKPARQATSPNLAAPAKAEGLFSGCSLESANDQWIIFKPVWKYGAKVYALNWVDPSAKPSLVAENSSVTGQWVQISENSAHVAVAQMFKDGSGKVEVYSLTDKKLVGSYPTTGVPQLEVFNSSRLVFYTLYGGSTPPSWQMIDPQTWTLKPLEALPSPTQGLVFNPAALSALQTRATFCQSWQS